MTPEQRAEQLVRELNLIEDDLPIITQAIKDAVEEAIESTEVKFNLNIMPKLINEAVQAEHKWALEQIDLYSKAAVAEATAKK